MKNKIKTIVSVLLLVGILSVNAETPQEGARAIHRLLKVEDYSKLFQERYTEWYKVEKEGVEAEVAVEKLSKHWKKKHEVILGIYEQLADAEYKLSKKDKPQISESGDVATATVKFGEKEIPYKLYQMKDGRWGFHM